jgi:uncharacterized membrane protein
MDKPHSLEEQFEDLKTRLTHLESLVQCQVRRIYALEQQGTSSFETPPPASPPPLQEPASSASSLDGAESGTTRELPQDTYPDSPISSETARVPQPSGEDVESLIAANWLNKIGMVATVLGVGYFLKYAIDNQWIGETGRVSLGIAMGLGFLLGGEKLEKKQYRGYALTVLGGGITILYLSIFAAFSFYKLLAQLPAFVLMVMITATAVLLSLRYNSKIVAYFGLIGGFLTPVMLSTGRDNQLGLFGYIALLDLGILTLAYFRNWRSLNLTAFVLTQLTFLAWTSTFYTPAKLWRTELLLSFFFLLFAGVSFLYNLVHQQKTSVRDLALIILNASAYFLWTYGLLESQYFSYLGFFAVLLAAFYIALSRWVWRLSPKDSYLYLILLGVALTFLTIAVPVQLKQSWITTGWVVEAVVLTWIGTRLDNRQIRLAALVVVGLVLIRLLFYDSSVSLAAGTQIRFLLNRRSFTFATAILGLLAIARLYSAFQKQRAKQEPAGRMGSCKPGQGVAAFESLMATGLLLLANSLLIFLVTSEIQNYYQVPSYRDHFDEIRRTIRSQKHFVISSFWAVYAIILVVVGIVWRYRPVRLFAILLFGITIVKVFFIDLSELERGYRIVSFIGLGAILLTVSFLYQRYKDQITKLVS